jgi:hypothetical protein
MWIVHYSIFLGKALPQVSGQVRLREGRTQSTLPIVDHFTGDTTIKLVQRTLD